MMRRTPLKRGKPLKRKTWLRSVSKTNSYRRRPRDLVHMGKVARLPCAVRAWARILYLIASNGTIDDPDSLELRTLLYQRHALACMPITTCFGRVQVDHVGERAYGHRSPDNETAALCMKHHQERTGDPVWSGTKTTFSGFNAAEMRAWCEWAMRITYVHLEEMDAHAHEIVGWPQ